MLCAVTQAPEIPHSRRNSISTAAVIPTELSLRRHASSAYYCSPSSSSATIVTTPSTPATSVQNSDCEVISVHPAPYTSLRDILPPGVVNSPRPMTPGAHQGLSGSEISIRNRLVKQAAWAYLKPMSTSTDSDDGSGRCLRFSVISAVAALVKFVDRLILLPLTRAFKWVLLSIQIRSSA